MVRPMKRVVKLVGVAVIVGVAAVAASAAYAQSAAGHDHDTPQGWNYEIKDGKRVPKGTRTTNADGSFREEIKQGGCITVKEKTADGAVKTTRKCD